SVGFPGQYTLTLTPIGSNPLHRLEFNNGGDAKKIVRIIRWGDIEWSSFENAFYGCTNLEGINPNDTPDLSQVTSMKNAFRDTQIGVNGYYSKMDEWNVSNVTDMSAMFRGASSFNADIGNWDVSNVTDMEGMFFYASSFNQDIGGWNVGQVTNMANMFSETSFDQDIGGWNVSNVSNMGAMFSNSLINQDLGNWDVSNVTNMHNMFWGNPSFNQDLSNWDVSGVHDMAGMFKNASSFNQDLGSWDLNDLTGSTAQNMLDHSGMQCDNYSQTLQTWANAGNTPSNITLGAQGLQYSSGVQNSHNGLENDHGWTIVGDSPLGTCDVFDAAAFV